ncbi:serine protease FAM111A-like [Siniperca chuatsi]|uniref:serine protease FAM111A-like n=1 Tax=Siniperca chuatsi TaxID=119488 RepID=UPI001CE0EE4D|nr:serine protease FAM111A-like [Siniperca chuatsi]XP_044079144.1 serine protease FAM111A-like [Siniperca chuatsi]XP_044079145.1 serine protease FAM111A-like [Siniperca chuatsi]XP_044079146.1 serine protease FAM111A-like [Siniperca chuatsi]XP_044079147.1 serine protease FAM111A-like [Siniperca chuatsi]XP_044079148.1 serine protease FAM111A-like [Siniperca chuatsi]
MESKLNTKNNGPMDKVIKEDTDNQDGESSQPPNVQPDAEHCDKPETSPGCTAHLTQCQPGPAPRNPLVKKVEEPHATHSLEWCSGDKIFTVCNKAGTVGDLLKTSPEFREIAGKNKDKELVIRRDRRAISSHFPCSLNKNERLTVTYIKAVDKPKQSHENRGPVHPKRKRPSGELVMFHVLARGGKDVVKIMRNPALETQIQEITVYAYKGERVKQALRRGGHLHDKAFKKNCVLSNTSTKAITEMSNLVDDLDGKSFKIILFNKSSPPDSQPSSLDAYMMQNDSQRSDSDGNQDPPQQSTTTESVNDNTPKKKPKLNSDMAPKYQILGEIPNSKTMQGSLSSQFSDLVKRMKTQQGSKRSPIRNLFRVEYGKNAQTCREVKTMKKLMDLSSSVCHVRINRRAGGSGFLLFDKFVLTNGHVVKNIYNASTGQLNEKVTVHFSFESLDPMDGGQESGAAVEDVVGFEHWLDGSGHEYDWALLRLGGDQKLPDCLLTHFGFLPQSGGICIIGHPDGGVKKIDPCLIIETEDRNQVLKRHYHENPCSVEVEGSHYNDQPGPIQLLTDQFFLHVGEWVEQRKALTYESCFYFGSSGSPVFDEHCNVVAMHSGGYAYRGVGSPKLQSVIEFGLSLSVIIERIIIQIVERGKFDVLKEYLACSYSHQNMMTNLKKLVESRNLTAFKDAVNNSVVTNDESLKTFFEFLSQREEPQPMDFV